MAENKMREILVEKVTVNIGTGAPGERLDMAKELLQKMTNRTPVQTQAKKRNPVWKLRVGLPIGAKVTLRKKAAMEFLEKALLAKRRMLKEQNFDSTGNFSFGVAEYIDFPGLKYDPRIGMFGFDISVTLKRRGKRVSERKIRASGVGKGHRVTKEDAKEFVKSLNVKVE